MEHSQLDFTAVGVTADYFHTFSNFISRKNIMSTIFSYTALAALILLLIIILPCIVKTLPQSTQKFATELHLAVLKNKKKGKIPGASTGDPSHDEFMWKRPDEQGGSGLEGIPGPARASTLKPESACLTILCLSPTLLTYRGPSPTTFLWRKST